jgi:prepilin-type N-terminal cleavage/methylation domain-containing protein
MASVRIRMAPPSRAGFTLTELLVATAVFIIGFSAAFSMFLSAVRYRAFADSTTRNAMATASEMGEIYLDSGTETANLGPVRPSLYSGNGDATQPPNAATGMSVPLYVFNGIPGALGRVKNGCAVGDGNLTIENQFDASGNGPAGIYADGPFATAIQVDIVSMVSGDRIATTDYTDLNQRLHIFYPNDPTLGTATAADACDNVLVQRGIASTFRAVIVRHPHWYYTK